MPQPQRHALVPWPAPRALVARWLRPSGTDPQGLRNMPTPQVDAADVKVEQQPPARRPGSLLRAPAQPHILVAGLAVPGVGRVEPDERPFAVVRDRDDNEIAILALALNSLRGLAPKTYLAYANASLRLCRFLWAIGSDPETLTRCEYLAYRRCRPPPTSATTMSPTKLDTTPLGSPTSPVASNGPPPPRRSPRSALCTRPSKTRNTSRCRPSRSCRERSHQGDESARHAGSPSARGASPRHGSPFPSEANPTPTPPARPGAAPPR